MMLEQPNLPTQEGLNALYGAWNPMSYMQGHLNQDLASQFRDQAYRANAGDLAKTQLANEQSIQMNPLLLEQQRNSNTKGGVEARIAADTEADSIKATHSKLATQMTDDNIKQLQNNIQDKLINGTPEEQRQASVAYNHLKEVMAAKTLQDAELLKATKVAGIQAGSHIKGAEIAAGASKYAADVGAASRNAVADTNASAKIEAANIHQNVIQRITTLSRQPQSPERDAAIQQLTNIAQVTAPTYGTAVNLPALAGGSLERNADKPAKLSDEDLIKKYNK